MCKIDRINIPVLYKLYCTQSFRCDLSSRYCSIKVRVRGCVASPSRKPRGPVPENVMDGHSIIIHIKSTVLNHVSIGNRGVWQYMKEEAASWAPSYLPLNSLHSSQRQAQPDSSAQPCDPGTAWVLEVIVSGQSSPSPSACACQLHWLNSFRSILLN